MPIDATQPYDADNIFAKILRGEIPCKQVYRDEWSLAFHDINPQAPTHVLFVPRQAIATLNDLVATDAELIGRLVLAIPDQPEGSLAAARQFLEGRAQDVEVLGHVRGAL